MFIICLPSTLIRLVPTFSIIIQVSPSCVRPLLNTSGIPSVITANTSLFQSLSSTFLASLSFSSSLLVQYRGTHLFKFKGDKFFVCNPCQSSPSLTILVPLWFIIISSVFFFLSELLFSCFLPFKGNFFLRRQNNSKIQ